jgi:Mg-chelatase subunit ChlD
MDDRRTQFVYEVQRDSFRSSLLFLLQKVDRIVGFDNVSVTGSEHDDPIPCYSTGHEIFINWKVIQTPRNLKEMVTLFGANYHELCHVLFTPGADNTYVQEITRVGHYQAYNVLEDQRIENIFIGMFPSAKNYFVSMFSDLVLKIDQENRVINGDLYPLTHGRYYLPKKLRYEVRSMFERENANNKQLAKKYASIIDEYTKLVLPRDMSRARDLVREFASFQFESMHQHGVPNQHAIYRNKSNDTRKSIDPQIDNSEGLSDKDQDDTKPDEDGEAKGEGSSDGGQSKENRESTDGPESGSSVSEDDTESESKNFGQGAGGNGRPKRPLTPAEITHAFRSLGKEILKDENVKKEVQAFQKSARDWKTRRPVDSTISPVTDAMRQAVRRITKEVKVSADIEPGWNSEQNHGRLNVRRAMRAEVDPNAFETAFATWDEGMELAASVEVVLMLDMSGSMHLNHAFKSVTQMAWVLKAAIEAANISNKVSVFVFSSGSEVLYSSKEKVDRNTYRMYFDGGSTNPSIALEWAVSVMESTKCENKLCIILTDGTWDGGSSAKEPAHQSIKSMNDNGVLTVLFGINIGGRNSHIYSHGQRITFEVKTPLEMVEPVRRIVKTMTNKSLASARSARA